MGLYVGSKPVKAVYVGSTPVKAVYVGAEKVWPTRETVQITLGTGYEARDQLRAALADRGLNYQTVEEIPFEIELVGAGSVRDMFYYCSSLTSAPAMETSSVTDMTSLFSGCSSLTQAPAMDTSSVMYMNGMFYNCASLTQVPDLDVGQAEGVNGMFERCSSLMDGMVRLIRPDGTLPPYRSGMITNSGLTREPFFLPDGTPIP